MRRAVVSIVLSSFKRDSRSLRAFTDLTSTPYGELVWMAQW
jgi:hypothetical protein